MLGFCEDAREHELIFRCRALSILTIVRYPISGAAVMFAEPMFKRLGV